MLNVGIVGAAGYAGAELVRLILQHPHFNLVAITSNAYSGKQLSELYPSFIGLSNLIFLNHNDPNLHSCDIVFLATPHTVAMKMAPELLKQNISVIDLSADFRLKDQRIYEKWYSVEHCSPKLLSTAYFGLPEIFPNELQTASRDFKNNKAVLVACAGCYPTASSLAAIPIIDLTQGMVVVDAISGLSGAGRNNNDRTRFCSASDNFEAYGVLSHRHTPEIEQILNISNRLVFTPHLAPASRGLLSTVTMQLKENTALSLDNLYQKYCEYFSSSFFVHVLPKGNQPKTLSVIGTNQAHIGIACDDQRGIVVATCAIDNLLKGAAGQAIQCANIICGFDANVALTSIANPM